MTMFWPGRMEWRKERPLVPHPAVNIGNSTMRKYLKRRQTTNAHLCVVGEEGFEERNGRVAIHSLSQ